MRGLDPESEALPTAIRDAAIRRLRARGCARASGLYFNFSAEAVALERLASLNAAVPEPYGSALVTAKMHSSAEATD
jgi:hypothetical protein